MALLDELMLLLDMSLEPMLLESMLLPYMARALTLVARRAPSAEM